MAIKAVELTRNIRDKMYEETKDMTKAKYLAYIRQGNKQFQEKKDKRDGRASVDYARFAFRQP